MSEKSEAEVLADALTAQPVCICHAACYIECACDAIWPEQWVDSAAAKLRRLHAENAELRKANDAFGQRQEWWNERMVALEAQRDALRAELKEATEAINDPAVNNLRTLAESIRMLCAQHDALLEALRTLLSYANVLEMRLVDADGEHRAMQQARAAIKAVEEGK